MKGFVAGRGQRAGYENIPGFRSVAVGGLGPFGLMAQDGLRQSFQTIEQGLQFSILLRSGANVNAGLKFPKNAD